MKQILYLISSLLCMAGLCVGCDADEAPVVQEKEIVEVPVEFNLTSSGRDLMTRVNPDTMKTNMRPIFVDKVKIYTYKRPSDQPYKTDEEGFLPSDTVKLTAIKTGYSDAKRQPRYIAKGKVPMESGYQYRMTAVAYSEKQGENTLFAMNRSYYDNAEIELQDKEEYKTPELFFGNVVAFDKDTLFSYEDVKDKQSVLSGWLYRGVAGIELNLKNVDAKVLRIDLLADSINTRVKARVYDDFLTSYGKQRDGSFKHFLLGSWQRGVDKLMQPNDSISIANMNLLAVCTSLSLRITMKDDEGEKNVVCRLKVRELQKKENTEIDENKKEENGIQLRSIPGDGGNGTGIIPDGEQTPINPEEPDPDPADNNPYQICFKRNHYYRIRIDYSQLTTKEYVIEVTVNPNWDGDVYLPLDKGN